MDSVGLVKKGGEPEDLVIYIDIGRSSEPLHLAEIEMNEFFCVDFEFVKNKVFLVKYDQTVFFRAEKHLRVL